MKALAEKDNYDKYVEIIRETEGLYDKTVSESGLSKGAFIVLWTLYDFGRPCTQKEICENWHENKQTVNSAVKKLIEEGYIDIAPSPVNLREKLLTFTEKGRFFSKRTIGKVFDAEKRAFNRLLEDEQKEAVRISEKYYKLLKEEIDLIKGEEK